MYRRGDPRLRRTLNEISQTLESANESAQANIFSFSQHYVGPCLSGLNKCFEPCAGACFPARDQRTRRLRGRSNGRAELSFDFYDDWDDDENDGLLGWGNDEFDRLVSGGGGYGTSTQPARQRAMSYGARRDAKGRRKNVAAPHDVGDDPTMIPSSSYFGFFGKLTGKMGGKSLKYKPSAADLQEHPGAAKKYAGGVGEPLLEDSEEEEGVGRRKRHGRARSGTAGSGNTTDSFSSRGDIFPSEDEDDAVPLDDEFAMVLERRTTNSGHDETSSGKTPRSSKRPSTGSRRTTRTISSRSTRSSKRQSTQSRTTSKSPVRNAAIDQDVPAVVADLNELKQEEERLRLEQEQSIAIKREAAQRLAQKRGLSISEPPTPAIEIKPDDTTRAISPTSVALEGPEGWPPDQSKSNHDQRFDDVEPFPAFDPHSPLPTEEVHSAHTEGRENYGEALDDGRDDSTNNFVPAQLPKFT